ncbi:choline O-acetyltransferase isoform X1 [Aphidius gifuensis]|nr:choline O-acetyltransferase isoform X1 [Aphidius gifuensis]XP_044018408.1 choline O-acetyltransferase isoform X1 [Aphidius gifuensis]XP_044018409.1 choline O-acetyltransferase isoform X1 [Aphidius gifuensis]
MQKYLAQIEAISPSHLEKSKQLVRSFLQGPGPKLQQFLVERRHNTANWATEWWLEDMYLTVPLGLPINSNPGLASRPKNFSTQRDAAIYLARFLMELFDYQETLDRNDLDVDVVKCREGRGTQKLCMAQHHQILKIYRRPGEIRDEQIILDRTTSGDHIIIAHHNQFYSIPVRASDRGRITESELIQQIQKIMETPADPRTPPVGILTSAKRPVWARSRSELMKNEQNRHNIELLERCLCVVCIDEDILPVTFNEPYNKNDRWLNDRDYANVLHHCLHGGGSRHLGANRWYDKTVHVIIGKDGFWGMTYEHSAGEAPAIFNAFEMLTEKVDSMPLTVENLVPSHLPSPEKLDWYINETSRCNIREAMTTFDALVEDLDLCILWFKDYSKEFVKACKISPDAYVQLALQLTYFRLHGRLVATYESASIRRFSKGRVDVIRAASPESLAWVKAMCQDDPELQNYTPDDGIKRVQFTIYSEQKIMELFDLAVKRQTKEIADNIYGSGIDNHLMGLRFAAMEICDNLPELFTDESFGIVHHFALSTSQVTTRNDTIVGYGPVVPDGYGCAYNLRKDSIIFSCSAFHSDGRTSARKYAQALELSLREMAAMLKTKNK